jgi:hypothetical protein
MTRPIYETQHDLDHEKEIADLLSKKWSADFHKLPIKNNVDFLVTREGKGIAFIEYKHREKLSFEAFPTYMVSLDKWMKMRDIQNNTGLPCHLVVRFKELTAWVNCDADFHIGINGRKDRNDPQDIEPMAYIDMKAFKFITQ